MTALVSAVFGGYDQPKPLLAGHGFDDAVLVTDVDRPVPGWRVVVEPASEHPRLAAKRAKCLPWEYADDERVLWLDGSFEVFPGLRGVADAHLADGDVVAWRHPSGRVDAYEEAAFSATVPKYAALADALREQCDAYQSAGLPCGSGLWEVGMLARRRTDATVAHGRAWLGQCERYTIQDQVSFPFVCWSRGVEVTPWRAGSHWDCGWVRWHPHRDEW